MRFIEKIKLWRKRRIERKQKKLEIPLYGPIVADREAMRAVMRLEGNRYKTAMLSSFYEDEHRKLICKALLKSRCISAEFHNPEGVAFYDIQRPGEGE